MKRAFQMVPNPSKNDNRVCPFRSGSLAVDCLGGLTYREDSRRSTLESVFLLRGGSSALGRWGPC